ncbi:MAG: DNA recombination protein RmuC [Candidatus Pacebacteria bacterium]|nr:DNA recombination protein RmuC [Candidatus Paceibacterota bacterium]
MNFIVIFGIILIFVLNGAFLWFIYNLIKKGQGPENKDEKSFLLLQNQMNELTKTMDSKMGESSKMMNESMRSQFGESQKLIKEITGELSQVKETSRQVVGFADQLKNLQDILKNPKQRGVLGEYYLESVLKNVLPIGGYQMQYKFEDGVIVDAVVILDKGKILPVDSKFSLENYNKLIQINDPIEKERLEKLFKNDLKTRIDETAKYIKPKEGTMDFAFMFIPSEGIYYDLLVGRVGVMDDISLIEYAFQKKKVIIVSPTSFLAYLQTVLQGLRSLQIEEKAKDIIKHVGNLNKHIGVYEKFIGKLGASISTVVNQYNLSNKEFKKIDKDVLKITGESNGSDLDILEKPEREE